MLVTDQSHFHNRHDVIGKKVPRTDFMTQECKLTLASKAICLMCRNLRFHFSMLCTKEHFWELPTNKLAFVVSGPFSKKQV